MGTLKRFSGGMATEHLATLPTLPSSTRLSVPAFKTINGISYSELFYRTDMGATLQALVPYFGLTPIGTADELNNYDFNDYEISAVGTTSFANSRIVNENVSNLVFSLAITNNTESEITVKCIKFKKTVAVPTGMTVEVLACAYYLEQSEWVTIPAGEIGALTVVISIGA